MDRSLPKPTPAQKASATLEASFRRYRSQDDSMHWLFFIMKNSRVTVYEARKFSQDLRQGDYLFFTSGSGLRIL